MAKHSQVQYLNEAVEKQLGFAAIVQTGNTLRLSGIVSIDEQMNVVGADDMGAQISQIYDIMEMTLAKSQATLANVVNEMIFVTDIAALGDPAVASMRVSRYGDNAPPAATAVQVSALFFPGAMIEIQATAVLD